jgi:tetratricopeptide (TPR) repeat protein
MGVVLGYKNRLDEAIEAFNKALSLNPNYAEVYTNMGVVLLQKGMLDKAIEAHKKSIALKPDFVKAHHNLMFPLLNSGKIKEGLDENEWRWKTDELISSQRHFLQPIWDGKQSLNGKRILLWSEQGIGDTLNWSSCIPLISSQAKHCILECPKKLVALLKRSFPNVEVKAINISSDLERDDFDFHLPMGSLYKHFIPEITQKPKPEAYLVPDPVRINFWKERLRSLGKGPYIGVCWKSSVVSSYRLKHYPPISEWLPVFAIPDVTFINLQYKDFANDLAKIKDDLGITVHHFEDLNQYDDVDDVAALCNALDIAVTTKVTPMILTSAVGTPTKIANWQQSTWNNILTNPVSSSVDMFEKNTWEPWDKIFNLIAQDISKQKDSFNYF